MRSRWKVIFLHGSVILSTIGGGGVFYLSFFLGGVWSGSEWVSGLRGGGGCLVWGVSGLSEGGGGLGVWSEWVTPHTPKMATAAVGTHPTVMHSYIYYD